MRLPTDLLIRVMIILSNVLWPILLNFTLINYDSRVVPEWKVPHITTLESQFTSVKCLYDWALIAFLRQKFSHLTCHKRKQKVAFLPSRINLPFFFKHSDWMYKFSTNQSASKRRSAILRGKLSLQDHALLTQNFFQIKVVPLNTSTAIERSSSTATRPMSSSRTPSGPSPTRRRSPTALTPFKQNPSETLSHLTQAFVDGY